MLTIRKEREADYRSVEDLTRKAFYNMYMPGCVEHYLVHTMRGHEDFIPELDLVLELDGRVIGNIMYTKARLTDEKGAEKQILTFGPVAVAPEHQRKGYGKLLMEASFEKAKELGYDVIVIFGSPANYVSRGFRSCAKYHVCLEDGKYPAAMLVKELVPGALDGRTWFYCDSPVMAVSEEEALRYDDTLEKLERRHQPSQEEFYIMSHSFVEPEEKPQDRAEAAVRIEHTAMYVNDLEGAKEFFVRYFGAKAGAGYHNQNTGFRSCFLTFGDGARLEIMTRPVMEDPEKTPARTGLIHMAFSVGSRERVEELTARLKEDGYQVLSGPRTTGDGYYESCVVGIEGNQIEITI